MLSSRNSGKYLTRTWERERELCARDKDAYTAAQQDYLEISGQSPGMGNRDRMEETMHFESSPIDPLSTPHTLDIRNKPEVGP